MDDCRLVSLVTIHKKNWKEDLGNYRPINLTLVLRKVMMIWSAIMWHLQDKQRIRPSQHGCGKAGSG